MIQACSLVAFLQEKQSTFKIQHLIIDKETQELCERLTGLKLLKEGYSISFLDQVTVNYGENGVSSGNFSPTYIEDNVHLFNDLLENSEKYVKSKLCIQLI